MIGRRMREQLRRRDPVVIASQRRLTQDEVDHFMAQWKRVAKGRPLVIATQATVNAGRGR